MPSKPNHTSPFTFPDISNWAVVRTGARWEKRVKQFFDDADTISYLPLVERRRVYGKRIRRAQLPLFSGYVFFDHDGISKDRIYTCKRIAQVLIPDDPTELRMDLENIALALHAERHFRPASIHTPGTPVEVKHGPMKGIVGEMVRNGPENLLVIRVRFLGATAELEIDEALVEVQK